MALKFLKQNKMILAYGLISILLISTIFYFLYFYNKTPTDNSIGISNKSTSNLPYNGSLQISFALTKNTYYKGDYLTGNLSLQIQSSNAKLNNFTVTAKDKQRNLQASQIIILNETYIPGVYDIPIKLKPAFDLNGFFALSPGNYSILHYKLNYIQRQLNQSIEKNSQFDFNVIYPTKFDLANHLNWKVKNEINLSANILGSNITLQPTATQNSYEIDTYANLTGYTRIYYNSSIFTNIHVSLYVNNQQTVLIANNIQQTEFIPVGNFLGNTSLRLLINSNITSSFNFNISIPTIHIPVLMVIADNNWAGNGPGGFYFQDPYYYIQQLDTRFQEIFNVTFVPVTVVDIDIGNTTTLVDTIDVAIHTIGTKLGLQNNTWQETTGISPGNLGLDVMLVMINRTMDHLGIILGNNGIPLNIGAVARGSQFEGNYPLPGSFADNLIQHELSHVFGAPDRWTDTDPPSIMTKSKPANALIDIALGHFWLTLTNWLEIDIQTMQSYIGIYL